ncbi:MAG: response regulator [Nitrospirae bacterium]|nr:response regulator [Nitrospirota bacterium]
MAEQLKARILLVDDEKQFLDTLSQRLEVRGLNVESVTSGEDALRMVKDKSFDAIVLDLTMPGLDGIEVLHRIKAEHPDLQIIMLTGHATVDKTVAAMKEGAVDFLEKPVDINTLINKIDEAKRRHIIIINEKLEEKMKEIIETKSW